MPAVSVGWIPVNGQNVWSIFVENTNVSYQFIGNTEAAQIQSFHNLATEIQIAGIQDNPAHLGQFMDQFIDLPQNTTGMDAVTALFSETDVFLNPELAQPTVWAAITAESLIDDLADLGAAILAFCF